ncbi:hypothetical protein CO086_02345 [Candidatus Uhrbacteria bacterium CG_4_9_14_0_8_um_filter_41_16]|nr:MAG: hypothetical protein CO086_02345 [Candidatus Uhrbacteria bacterium CG_4_9_14_0_8_um_filter_41_16]
MIYRMPEIEYIRNGLRENQPKRRKHVRDRYVRTTQYQRVCCGALECDLRARQPYVFYGEWSLFDQRSQQLVVYSNVPTISSASHPHHNTNIKWALDKLCTALQTYHYNEGSETMQLLNRVLENGLVTPAVQCVHRLIAKLHA